MDVKLVNPFINATINVLETMAFITVNAGNPYLKKDYQEQVASKWAKVLDAGKSITIGQLFFQTGGLSEQVMKKLREEAEEP